MRPYVSFQQNYFHAPRCIAVDLQKFNIAMTLQTYVPIKVKDKELDGLKLQTTFEVLGHYNILEKIFVGTTIRNLR